MAGLIEQLKRAARLPSPPGTALQILRLSQQEEVSLGEVAETLAADPALSVRILKYANSALVGVRREITTVREAVVLLGMRSVRMMALSFSLVSTNDKRACPGFDYVQFWSQSLARAVAARHLAKARGQVSPEEAFAAGLLASIGKLVFAVAMPAEYAEILQHAGGPQGDTAPFEQQRFGMNYRRAGAELMDQWGIPARLCNAVRYQGNAKDAALSEELMELASTVNDAGQYAELICAPTEEDAEDADSQTGAPASSGQRVDTLGAMRTEYRELAAILSLRKSSELDVDRIQAEAGEVLSELSLAAQLRSDAVEREKKDLQVRAWRDGLTGVANRAAFDRELDRVWAQAVAQARPVGLIFLDVDFFKSFNDRFGHTTGDAVLRGLAERIPTCCRDVDLVARYGGEEFAVILPNADRLIMASIAVNIRRAIEEHPIKCGDMAHRVTVSVGAAILPHPAPPYTPQKLIEAADQQLYRSKSKGRNTCSMIQLPSHPRRAMAASAR